MAIDLIELNEMFVLEWNARQKKFQIQALGEVLKSNLLAAVRGLSSGYVPVAIAHTEAEALKMSKLIDRKLNMRSQRGDSSDTLH